MYMGSEYLTSPRKGRSANVTFSFSEVADPAVPHLESNPLEHNESIVLPLLIELCKRCLPLRTCITVWAPS